MKRPAIFFDRDNTLIVSNGYLGDPKRVQLINGAADAVAAARSIGFATVIFSNQSGVARGYFTEDDVRAVNRRIELLLRQSNRAAVIDRNEYCPEHPQAVVLRYRRDSSRRKPAPGMILAAAEALALDLPSSWVVGDAPRDIAAGKAAGCRTIWFRDPTITASPAASGQAAEPDFIVATLAEAINIVRTHPHHSSDFQAMPPLPEHSLSGTSPTDEELDTPDEPEPVEPVAAETPSAAAEEKAPEPQSREADADELVAVTQQSPTDQLQAQPGDLDDDDHGAPPLILQAAMAEARVAESRSHADPPPSRPLPAWPATASRPSAAAIAEPSADEDVAEESEVEETEPIGRTAPEPDVEETAEEAEAEEIESRDQEAEEEETEEGETEDREPVTDEDEPAAIEEEETPEDAASPAASIQQPPGDFDQGSFDASITRLQKLTEQVIRQDLTRLEGLAEQILVEMKQSRSDQTQRGDFSVSKLLAGIALVLSLAAAFAAFLYRGDPTQVDNSMRWAIFLLLLTIALLMVARDH